MKNLSSKTITAISSKLKATHGSLYEIELLSIQVVKNGYIAVFNCHPRVDIKCRSMLGEYERLAFFNKKLDKRNDIILQ